MTTLTEEQMNDVIEDCPMDDVGFDPEEIDEFEEDCKGSTEEVEVEVKEEEE